MTRSSHFWVFIPKNYSMLSEEKSRAGFTTAKRWKQPRQPSVGGHTRISRLLFSLQKEVLSPGTTQNQPEDTAQWEKPVAGGQTLRDSICVRHLQLPAHRSRKQDGGCPGLGGAENGDRVSVVKVKRFEGLRHSNVHTASNDGLDTLTFRAGDFTRCVHCSEEKR